MNDDSGLKGRIITAVLDSLLDGDPVIRIVISPYAIEVQWE